MSISEKLTYCTKKIIAVISENLISTGTGFFMEFNIDHEKGTCQPVIITNKHVVKNAKKIIYSECYGDENNKPIDNKKFTITLDTFKIIEHPDKEVDLCAIAISGAENAIQNNNMKLFKGKLGTDIIINEEELQNCSAMEEIIMIGYPNGLEDSYNNKPIIRRGITSTHIKLNYQGKKEFLIDMACYPGSSGSPVFICNENIYSSKNTINIGSRINLIGILYAGPQYTATGEIIFENISTNPKAVINIPNNLGVVIKASRIKELEDFMKNM